MEKYKIIRTLGDGTFGSVVKAVNKTTREVVAIKRMKKRYRSWRQIMDLAELKFLMKLHHPNIVDIQEIMKHKNELHIVFEYLKKNLYQLTKDRKKPFNDVEVRNIMYQTLQGMAYMHRTFADF
jgi:male germ cell-associated kinase